jgi:hypothetical protein
MSEHIDFSLFPGRRFKVVVPHVPYLPSDQDVQVSYSRVRDDGEFYQFIKLKAFPLDEASYSYQEAVDVLEIFTSRWQHGRCDLWTEPYAKAIGDPEVTFTLTEFKLSSDAVKLLEKFCRNRKRKDGLGGKLFSHHETEDDDDTLD